jgi:hypothetical protein
VGETRDDREDGRWVSYVQLARARAISKESAIRLARRERWRKMPGNEADKTVRVLVPETWLQPAARPDALPHDREDIRPELAAAHARADEANRRADAALTVADTSLAQLADANARADRAEARADALRQRVDELQAGQQLIMDAHARALAEAQDHLERVREAAEDLRQAEVERQARGLLARLRAALRGR